jgi:hypothetical protein
MAGRATRGGRKTITHETGISAKFDDTEYKESSGGYDGPPPPPGLYPAKVSSVGPHTTGDTAIVWTFDITSGKYAGWRGWSYTDLDNAKWKTQDILVAAGLMEPGGEISVAYETVMKNAEPLRIRIINEDYNDELRPKIRSFLKASADTANADEDEAEEDEDFDDKKKPAAKPARRGRAAKEEPEPEPEADEDGDGDEERQDREEELDSLTLAQLKKAAKEAGLTLADYRGKEKGEIVELILDKEFPEDAEEEKGGELDLDALEEELEDMDLKELTAKAKEFGATRADLKGKDEEELIDLILEKAEEQNPSF